MALGTVSGSAVGGNQSRHGSSGHSKRHNGSSREHTSITGVGHARRVPMASGRARHGVQRSDHCVWSMHGGTFATSTADTQPRRYTANTGKIIRN